MTGEPGITPGLRRLLDNIGHDGAFPNSIPLAPGVKDVTGQPEVSRLIHDFAPEVKVRGLGLWSERFGAWGESKTSIWGGVLTRALENEKSGMMCLQYLYIYTRQLGLISAVLHGILPILMGVWGLSVLELYSAQLPPSEDFWFPLLVSGGVCLPVLITGIIPHLRDIMTRKLHPRVTDLFLFFAPIMWAVVYTFQTEILYALPGTSIAVLFNVPLILIYFGIIIGLGGWGILSWPVIRRIRGVPGSHKMDYVPVFVWIKRGPTGWLFHGAVWDYHHYNVEGYFPRPRVVLSRLRPSHLKDDKRVRLYIENPWHSMTQSLEKGSRFNIIAVLLLFLSATAAISMVLLGLYLEPMFILFMLVLVYSGVFVLRYPFSIRVDDILTQNDAHLSKDWLDIFWNLKEEDSQLKIRQKLQDPFVDLTDRGTRMRTFEDAYVKQRWHLWAVLLLFLILVADVLLLWLFIPGLL